MKKYGSLIVCVLLGASVGVFFHQPHHAHGFMMSGQDSMETLQGIAWAMCGGGLCGGAMWGFFRFVAFVVEL